MVHTSDLTVGTKVKIRGRGIAEIIGLRLGSKYYVDVRFSDGLESPWPIDQMALAPPEISIEERVRQKQQRAQERKTLRENANIATWHDDLKKQGYPEFTKNEKYESTIFLLTDETRAAYYTLLTYVTAHLAELTAAEANTPVYGRIGMDYWADASTTVDAVACLTSLGVPNAARHVKLASQSSHGIKANLCLPNDPKLAGLNDMLQTNFLHARCFVGGAQDLRTVQIGKRSLLEQLIRDGILPEEIQ